MTTNYINETNIEEAYMTDTAYDITAAVLFFIGFFGFSLNLTVIVLMFKNKHLWTPLNVILFNLVFSDFLVSILGNPWTFVSALNHKWIFGSTMCQIYGFFMAWLGITSILTLTILAFERYMLITSPFKASPLEVNTAVTLITLAWISSLLLTVPPLLGWSEYVNEAANISCSVNWKEKSPNTTSYIVFLFIFGLAIPVTIIVYSYLSILITIRKRARLMGKVSKTECKVSIMTLLMILAFLFAWSPYAALALVIQFGNDPQINSSISVIPSLVAKSSICYNPIIYIGLNTQFHNSIRQIFCLTASTKSNTTNRDPCTSYNNKRNELSSRKNFQLNLTSVHNISSSSIQKRDGEENDEILCTSL